MLSFIHRINTQSITITPISILTSDHQSQIPVIICNGVVRIACSA